MIQNTFTRLKNLLLRFLSNPKVIQWGQRLLFTAAVLLFVSVQLFLTALPLTQRTAPPETDDSYTYILKGVEMQSCFLQNCPALEDLRSQLLDPSPDPEISWRRYREYVRSFSIYHPLHSLMLAGLHQIGLSWEMAYSWLIIVGSLGLSLAIAFWFYCLFGSGPASIALFLLAFTVFPGQGIHYIVPSNLALGIALLIWGILFKWRTGSHWFLIVSTLLLVTMHPIGRIYALLTVFWYLFLASKPLTRKYWLFSALSILIIVLPFLLPLLVKHPDFSIIIDPPPAGWKAWWGYYNNFTQAGIVVKPWLDSFGGLLPIAFFVIIGIFSLFRAPQRSPVLVMGLLLGGLLSASLLQVLPRYPAEAFGRAWVPFVMLMIGLAAHAIWEWAKVTFYEIQRIIDVGLPDFRDDRLILSLQGWVTVCFLVIGVALAQTGFNWVISGQRAIRATFDSVATRQNSLLVSTQPETSLPSDCGDVLYLAEVPMHFYFAHGWLACGAVYYPALNGTPEAARWVQQNPDLNYLVAWNPTISSTVTGGGNPLALKTGDRLEIHLPDGWVPKPIYIYLENRGAKATLNISALQAAEQTSTQKTLESIVLPAAWSGWHVIDLTASELQAGFSLNATEMTPPVFLRRIRLDKDAVLNWPWNQGLTLSYQENVPDIPARIIQFDSDQIPPLDGTSWKVLNDLGDTVLLKRITP